ncbi:class I SAM-dependent methyltransferase [Sporolactobacillus sp. THM7-7]|nr:class I SAM-dependent methyltransferase [Sporolactobacillus sp. THM7-7]
MQTTTVSELFSILNQSSILIKKQRQIPYLEALSATGRYIYEDRIGEEGIKKELETLYAHFFHEGMTAEEIRRAFQLAILKGMKEAHLPNHELTPDSLVLLFGHIVSLLMNERPFSVLDPAVGTANLLTGIMNQAKAEDVAAYGADTDGLLLNLAVTNANLQQKDIHFFHQDGLKPLLIEPCDIVVCDVPVGIYPDKKTAETYELNEIGGKAYTHFLFIEQGIKALKDSGYLLYLIPNRLFSEDRERHFHRFIHRHAVILALLQLPLSLFKNQEAAKSVLLLQKKERETAQANQALLAEMPSFSNQEELRRFMRKMDDWFARRL